MTIPRQTADTKISHPAPSDSASQAAIDDAHSNHGTTHSLAGGSSIALRRLYSMIFARLQRLLDPFRDQLFTTAVEIKDGYVTVPTTPGLGVVVDEERLNFYAKA